MPRRSSCDGRLADVARRRPRSRPPVGSMSRLIILSVVVLPQPDGPTSTTISPAGMSRLSRSTAGWSRRGSLGDVGERMAGATESVVVNGPPREARPRVRCVRSLRASRLASDPLDGNQPLLRDRRSTVGAAEVGVEDLGQDATEPSGWRWVSTSAATMRGQASAEPLSVWTTSVPLPAGRPVADVGPPGLVVGEPRHRRHLEPPVDTRARRPRCRTCGRWSSRGRRCRGRAPGRRARGRRRSPRPARGSRRARPAPARAWQYASSSTLSNSWTAQQAPGVAPGRARLPPEARRVGHEPHRQVGLVEDLVAGQRRERHLGGGDGPEVVALDVVGVVGELRQVAGGDHRLGAHQGRRADLLVGVGVAVERELDEGPQRAGRRARGTSTNIEPDSFAARSRSRMPSSAPMSQCGTRWWSA